MPIRGARYKIIEAGAKGPEAIRRAFENQVAYCRDNGAPVTARICHALLQLLDGDAGGPVMERVRTWPGAALSDALPLRVAGGLHALHQTGTAPELAPMYGPRAPAKARLVVGEVLERHADFLSPWLDGPPQTNEAGRSASYAAALLWLADQGLPRAFSLLELGSSAGINLMMSQYFYDLGGVTAGPRNAAMRIVPEWRGSPPPEAGFEIVAAEGCDPAPLDLTDAEEALRLKAYIWPEATERFRRLEAAIAAARIAPPRVAKARAKDWLGEKLSAPAVPGVTRVILHSVVWQYIAEDERHEIIDMIERAGSDAREEAPLAWVSLEANRDTHRHELTVAYWPGGEMRRKLATAHPHGAWIDWDA